MDPPEYQPLFGRYYRRMTDFRIGATPARIEDDRFLRGAGRYTGDLSLPGQAHAVVLRSPHAHAVLRGIDAGPALALPGVLAVFTVADLAQEGLGVVRATFPRQRPDGTPMFAPTHLGLARERVRYVGEPVALVVAETLAAARDAAEAVVVDYEPLPAVTETASAVGGPAVWDECPDNVSHLWQTGDAAATDAAFARAAHVVRRRYAVTRVHAQYMEPRTAIGVHDAASGRLTLHTDCQYPNRVRDALADRVFRMPREQLRVVSQDVGGAFGAKGWTAPEHRLVLFAARRLGRPVKWSCERSEAVLADDHGRDVVTEAELALDAQGRFLALRARTTANLGAYVTSDRVLLPLFTNVPTLLGGYAFEAAHVAVLGVLTNTASTAPYRGAGRPEATYVMERLIDDAARELGRDRIALRRHNLVPPQAMPYRNALGAVYDCGEFAAILDAALARADVAGFEARREASRARGRLRGLGVAFAIERAGSPSEEEATLAFDADGIATLVVGTKNQGQGHETVFRQIVADRLGLAPEHVRFVEGDTDLVARGLGSFGSRSTVIGGSAAALAAERIVEAARPLAAERLEAAAQDVVFADGRFTIAGTDRSIALRDVARAAPGLAAAATFSPAENTYPNAAHACEVEIDPDTGEVTLARYTAVDDVGTEINPVLVKGQVHGGIAQGAGQILLEQVVYDRDSGQVLSASFTDYAMPRADHFPALDVGSRPVPTALNPLGAKGAGEAGTVGAMPAVMNAVMDALAPAGVTHLDMPATAERVWRAVAGRIL